MYVDQKHRDVYAIYTYNQIARIAQIDPALGALLRRQYSAARQRDDAVEREAGLLIERIHGEHLAEMSRRGIV
jgi:hypothetical protein